MSSHFGPSLLLLINAYDVWQYVLSPKNKKVMDRIDPIVEKIERQVERVST